MSACNADASLASAKSPDVGLHRPMSALHVCASGLDARLANAARLQERACVASLNGKASKVQTCAHLTQAILEYVTYQLAATSADYIVRTARHRVGYRLRSFFTIHRNSLHRSVS